MSPLTGVVHHTVKDLMKYSTTYLIRQALGETHCRDGQGAGQYIVKHTENGQTQTDNIDVGLNRFYCILVLTIFLLREFYNIDYTH